MRKQVTYVIDNVWPIHGYVQHNRWVIESKKHLLKSFKFSKFSRHGNEFTIIKKKKAIQFKRCKWFIFLRVNSASFCYILLRVCKNQIGLQRAEKWFHPENFFSAELSIELCVVQIWNMKLQNYSQNRPKQITNWGVLFG